MQLLRIIGISALLSFPSCLEVEQTYTNNQMDSKDTVNFVVTKEVLSEYFRTDNIQIDTIAHHIIVNVSDSKLLEERIKKKGLKHWEAPEALASTVATYQSTSLGTDVDSLTYILNANNKQAIYAYSVAQLKKVNNYILVCKKFASYLNDDDFTSIKRILSRTILENNTDDELKELFKSMFSEYEVDRTEFVGTKIVGNNYSIYIKFIYSPDHVQTYCFVFFENEAKIAGIQIPK